MQGRLDILERKGLQVFTISNHLKGQAVCDDPIDQRHRDILSDRVWGGGDPEGVTEAMVDAGYQDIANRWNPILDVFGEVGCWHGPPRRRARGARLRAAALDLRAIGGGVRRGLPGEVARAAPACT